MTWSQFVVAGQDWRSRHREARLAGLRSDDAVSGRARFREPQSGRGREALRHSQAAQTIATTLSEEAKMAEVFPEVWKTEEEVGSTTLRSS